MPQLPPAPPVLLLPEASDLWLSPAEKLRQREGWMTRVARLYLLRQQAILQWQRWNEIYRELPPA